MWMQIEFDRYENERILCFEVEFHIYKKKLASILKFHHLTFARSTVFLGS